MDLETLREKQLEFFREIDVHNRSQSKLETLRKRFIRKFPPESILSMDLEDYVLGIDKEEKDSFCYWLETKLMDLGKIKGGSPADKKFGLFYGKMGSDFSKKYRFVAKWGGDYLTAFDNIKSELYNLIIDGENDSLTALINNKVSNMFKGKILSTYYPDKYLSIFSPEHLDYFLNLFNVTSKDLRKIDPIEKRKLLVRFKNSDSMMTNWSLFIFERFLYAKFHPHFSSSSPFGKTIPAELSPNLIETYPNLSEVKPIFIDSLIGELKENRNGSSNNTRKGKGNYELQDKNNRIQGDKGEYYVFEKEKNFLKSIGRPDLADKVDRISLIDDCCGYDILSFDEKGNKKHIEVKSSKQKFGKANFLISSNELNKSKIIDNYYIYVVFEVTSREPKIWRIPNPFKIESKNVKVTPINFRVEIQANNFL